MARDFSKAFYRTEAWQTARGITLRRDNFNCQMCGARAEEVHHIIELIPSRMNDDNITLNPDNLISLCRDCHFKVHEQERTQSIILSNKRRVKPQCREGFIFDEEGNVVPKPLKVYIVYGSPASGKTTYVINHMSEGDMVIDLDMIGQALSPSNKKTTPEAILPTAIKIRDFLYELIKKREVEADCVWVVAGLPYKEQRESLRAKLNAELIYIESTVQECLQRAMRDADREDKANQRRIIEYWHKVFQK